MDKYIKQLLEQFSKVILPKFGAIVIENEETGELMFNEYLNYNDGKLDELIVKESNMELQEAQNMIAKYIRDIQAQIDKGESYDIFGLGSFSKNKDGEVEFSGNLKTGESKNKGDSADPSPAPIKKEEKKEETPKKKEEAPKKKKETPKKEDKKKEPKKKESTSDDKSEKKENKYVAPVTPVKEKSEAKSDKKDEPAKKVDDSKKADKAKKDAEEKAEKQKAKKKAHEDKANAKAKAKKEKEEAKKVKDKAKKDKKKSKEKKKKRKIGVLGWIIIVLIFIAAGGTITAGIYYDEISDYMGWNEFTDKKEMAQNDMAPNDESDDSETDEELTNETQVVDSLENDESEEPEVEGNSAPESEAEETNNEAAEEPVKEEEPIETYTTSPSNGSYHMIAGGFRDKSNAEDKVSELKSKGMDAKIIGRINGLHFVSAKSYSSLSAAKQDINNIQSQVPGAWIYKK